MKTLKIVHGFRFEKNGAVKVAKLGGTPSVVRVAAVYAEQSVVKLANKPVTVLTVRTHSGDVYKCRELADGNYETVGIV